MASQPRVLVVDDSADNRGLLVELLEEAGYGVAEACNGQQALASLQADRPDLVLLDLLMPVLDGFGVLEALKEMRGPFLPVIVLTATSDRGVRLRARALGAHEFLAKPIDRDELLVRVGVMIDLKTSVENISERVERERLQADRISRLEEAERYKDEFLSVMSHELRTPLNFIMGFASTLEDEVQGPLNSAQLQAVSKILIGSERMLRLVEDLLEVATIQAGELALRLEATPYEQLIIDVLATLAPLAAKKDLQITTAFDIHCLLVLDPSRIAQVLTNLVGNAIKFTSPGGCITVRTRQTQGQIVTEISDTGRGIALEDREKLFKRFSQIDMSKTRSVGGSGLGLAIAKGLVEAHGGHIEVVSKLGEGSTFSFMLPTDLANAAALN